MSESGKRGWACLLAVVSVACCAGRSQAEEFRFAESVFGGRLDDGGCSEGGIVCNFAWCSFRDRGTLFRWSDETGYSGGPDLDKPLVTDRPDFTEASSTVGRGVVQIEFGYTYIYNNDAGESVRLQSFGEPLLRYGILANWLEFRIGLFPVEERTRTAGTSNSIAGTEGLYTGLPLSKRIGSPGSIDLREPGVRVT